MRSPFHCHLKQTGSISRTNPELLRLARETGYSVEHLFKVATSQRIASVPLALSVSKAIGEDKVPASSISAAAL